MRKELLRAEEKLIAESERFKQLARELALKSLLNPGNTDAAQKAREHLIRAETFQSAATLVTT